VRVSALAPREERIPIDVPVELARAELPIDTPAPERPAIPQAAFDPARVYPAERARCVHTGTYRGYNVAFIAVYPVTYEASAGVLVYAPRLDITIETASSGEMLRRSLGTFRADGVGDAGRVGDLVDNLEASASYTGGAFLRAASSLVDPASTYPYVIITSSALEPYFGVLRDHKTSRGLRAKTVLIEDIALDYAGVDLQAKIREFIKDAYLNWECEYVLLAGDDDIIPHRGLYAVGPSAIDADVASDLYYAGLDGTWNDDADANWGEPEEADLLPEVSVGRAAVGDSIEATNFIAKLVRYENTPVAGQVATAQLVGEALSPGTWGGDYKDETRFGASSFGYTTAGLPAGFTVGTLYDRDLYPDAWDKMDLVALLNSGRHIVNHIGHADVTYGLRMYTADVDTLFTNDGISNTYFIAYSQGCYAGSFDNRSPSGYTTDCLGEHLTFTANAAVAFIGNTRYGWYMPYSTNGSSQHYDRQFIDAIFGENITEIGRANDDARIDNAPFVDVAAMRWIYYDLVLLGDPAMDVWTDEPGYLEVLHPDPIFVGDNQVELTVTDGAAAVEGARVAIFSDSTYASGLTDAAGSVRIDPAAMEPGELRVAVTAHNFYAYLDTVTVEVAGRPLLVVESFTADDDTTGASLGDGDELVEAGEAIEAMVAIANVGQDSAFGATAVMRTLDSYVTMVDSAGVYGDVAPDSVVVPGWSFSYQVSPAAPDGHRVEFEIAIACTDTSFARNCWQDLAAPDLAVAGLAMADSAGGNGDGCIGGGETVELALELANGGSGGARGVSVVVSEDDPYVEVVAGSAYADSVAAGGQATLSPACVIALAPNCPEFHRVDLYLTITLANGRLAADTTAVYLGGSLEEDVEGGSPGWVHHGFNDMHLDEWHIDTYRNHTPGGGSSWKVGGEGSTTYANFAHSALETPELCLGSNAQLTFWHWIHAELNTGKYAWDGGIVEISTDGGETWSQLTPEGGYYYKIYPNYFSPFPGNTPCFAWTSDWTQVAFDLSAYQGRAKIRFRFGSDQYYGGEGWFIDDIAITDDAASVPDPGGDPEAPREFALVGIDPNPVASRAAIAFAVPRSSRVSIDVFDVTGRAVTRVANSVFAPGRYVRSLDCGAALAPGVYFVSMRAEGFAASRKLVVLR